MKYFETALISLVILVTCSILVLVGLEIFLRIYNSNGLNYDIEMWKYGTNLKTISSNKLIGTEHIPLSKGKFENVEIKINSLGFRDKEYEVKKPNNAYRIIVLGSSITLGWGVPDDKIYTEVVEERLNKNLKGEKIEIINTSVANFNTTREVEYFLTKCAALKPDMVILSFFINDAEILSAPTENYLMNHSQLAILLWSRYQQLSRKLGIKKEFVQHYKDLYADHSPGWVRCQDDLLRLADYCAKNKIRVLVVMIPDIHNLQYYPFLFIHKKIENKAKSLGFDFIDYYDVLKDVKAEDIWAIPGDPHPNEKGHAILASYLYNYLEKIKPWEK